MSNKERKNFSIKIVEEIFEECGGCCQKCGKSLQYGMHQHHKDGDSSNNSKENCQLLCPSCHGGEKYATYLKQKEAVIADLETLIKNETVSGATVDKKLDAIKLVLSLQGQIYNDAPLQPPIQQRLKDYELVMQHGLEKYEEGYIDGLKKNIEIQKKVK